MPLTRAALRRRRFVAAAFVFAAAVSLCAYVAVLMQARSDWSAALRPALSVQQLGSQAKATGGATLEPLGGSVAFSLNATAAWKLPTQSLSATAHRSIVIVSGELGFTGKGSSVSVDLGDGKPVLLSDAAYGPVTVPPAETRGFHIEIPPGSPCLRSSCPIVVRVRNAYWRIYRVGVASDEAISAVGEYR